jgi:hypothetical protein
MQVLERDPDYLSGDRIRQIRKELSTEIPGGHGPAGDPSAITYFDDWQNPAGAGTQSAVPDALARRAAPDRDGVEDFGAPTARGETAATRAAPPPFAATPPAPTGRRPVADVPGSMRRGAPPAPSASAALPVEGKVIYLDGTGQDAVAYIDVGSDEGVTPGMYFSIGSGRHRRAVLVVTEVFGKSSKAVVAGAEHYHGDFARGDRAVRIESLPAGP